MQNVAIIFKRKKLKLENQYKLTPVWYIIGDLIEEDNITYLKTSDKILTGGDKLKGILPIYNFAGDFNSFEDEYVYGFPISIEKILKVMEDDKEEYVQAFLEEYFEALSYYNYYQICDDINKSLYCYSSPKRIVEREYLDMSKSYDTAIEEYMGISMNVDAQNFSIQKSNMVVTEAKEDSNHINIKNLYINITSSLIGQDEQVKAVLSAIDINQTITNPRLKQNILICGDTGTGKTEIFRLVGKHLNIPYVVEDANQYTMEGYVGNSISDMLAHLLVKADNDLNKAQRGILIVDEIDKKAGGNGNEKVATTGVLEALLKLMEGGIYNFEYQKGRTIPFDTTNMTFVAMGAFSGLKNIANPKPPVGFNSNEVKEKNPFTTDNFDKFGLLPEFIGRCNRKIIMNPMDKDILLKILTTYKNSPIFLIEELFKDYNVKITYDDKEQLLENIVECALELKTGARALFEIVFKMIENALFKVQCERSYKKLVLSKETIKDNTIYLLK